MCLPPDVIPSLHSLGKARAIDPTKWEVDQRPFVWASASKPAEKRPSGAPWTAWSDTLYPGAPLPYSGINLKVGRSDEALEADSSLSLGFSLGTSATTTLAPKEFGIRQSEVWEPRPNGREAAAMQSVFCSPPSHAASCVDTHQQSLSRESSVVSCTSSPRISVPAVVGESSPSTKVPNPIDSCESSMSQEERSRRSSWVEELIEEDRMQNAAALIGKLRSGSARPGKTSRVTHHKVRHCNNRPAASKMENSTSSKDVSMSESLFDNEDLSDDEEEDGPGVSEKRRKRMLSNRTSAQRSRQRRQERLDTLEVLVLESRGCYPLLAILKVSNSSSRGWSFRPSGKRTFPVHLERVPASWLPSQALEACIDQVAELRVHNAALTRRTNSAAAAAKKFEEENKMLRDRFTKQKPAPLSDSNENGKTTENSDVAVNNKNGALWRPEAGLTKTSSSEYTDETRQDNSYSRESSEPLERDDEEPVEDSKPWYNYVSGISFDFGFDSDLTDSTAATYRGTPSRTALPENSGAMNGKDLQYQSAIMSPAQSRSFQGLDPFGIDLEQCNQEMDNSLDSRSADNIWLDSLAKCLT